MSEKSLRFSSWWNRDWLSRYGIIAFGCTVWSFTTHGECGLSLSLGLRSRKTNSSDQKMKSN